MRLLIDTNILLDVLMNRDPFCKDSSLFWKLCETGQVQGYVSVLSFANLVYVLNKQLSPEKTEKVLSDLSLIFTFCDLTVTDIKGAASLHMKDYEDAIQIRTAERIKADKIITRNVKDFKDSSIPAVTPAEFVRSAL